jgi:hypothetical protein
MSKIRTTAAEMSAFVKAAQVLFGDTVDNIDRPAIKMVVASVPGMKYPWWLEKNDQFRSGRGTYSMNKVQAYGINGVAAPAPQQKTLKAPAMVKKIAKTTKFKPMLAPPAPAPTVEVSSAPVASMSLSSVGNEAEQMEHASLVPFPARGYVPFGHYNTVQSIVKSGIFYPAFVTGLSGNGKTMMIEQVCAQLGREFVRVNITGETDEDDLIGGFRLQDGKTVWQNGPVVVAMERGAILLLDEVDLGANKIMCLQGVLEGKPIYLKKINKIVKPAPGFTVLATANTKGQGSFDGKFVGTNVLNEAFLERFPITIEQEYPSVKTEVKIVEGALHVALTDGGVVLSDFEQTKAGEFVEKLVGWADGIRKLYYGGGLTEIISTRRLVHIINAFVIFGFNRRMAIELCLNRFDSDTKIQFLDLYSKIDTELDGIVSPQPSVASPPPSEEQTDVSVASATAAGNASAATVAPAPSQVTPVADADAVKQALEKFIEENLKAGLNR